MAARCCLLLIIVIISCNLIRNRRCCASFVAPIALDYCTKLLGRWPLISFCRIFVSWAVVALLGVKRGHLRQVIARIYVDKVHQFLLSYMILLSLELHFGSAHVESAFFEDSIQVLGLSSRCLGWLLQFRAMAVHWHQLLGR